MSQAVYRACGVSRPKSTPDIFLTLAAEYSVLAGAANGHAGDFRSIVTGLTAENEGPTTDAMATRMTGLGSSPTQLDLISDAAMRTSHGYASAGQALATGVLAMDALTMAAAKAVLNATFPPSLESVKLIRQILQTTKDRLQLLERHTTVGIDHALAGVSAPSEIDVGEQRPNESLSPEVTEYWQSLTDEQRLAAIEKLVADYAREHGIDPPPPIEYYDASTPEGQKGWLGYWDGTTLRINSSTLDNPIALNVAVHETGHAIQSGAEREYANYSAQDIADMKSGARPDVFRQYGLSAAEVARLVEARGHYRNDDWSYGKAPTEIDASRNVFEWSDRLTLERFKDYVE